MAPSYETRLKIIKSHSDPVSGTPYWINFFKHSKLTPEQLAENPLLAGPMDLTVMRRHSLDYFLPQNLLRKKQWLITGETSGFSGDPIVTAFTPSEFEAGFVLPFIHEARRINFPLDGQWLWGGPTGPHIIGKAVREILKQVNGLDPFAVDFDPRWYKKMPEGSMARDRYFEHVLEQMLRHFDLQHITVLFTTPPLVAALAERLSEAQRLQLRGLHYGGMAMNTEQYAWFREKFPNAIHMSGYGNSLFGMFPETGFSSQGLHYQTASERLALQLVHVEDGKISEVAMGERGRVMLSRFDESMLLMNVVERDEAIRGTDEIIDPQPEGKSKLKKVLY